MTEQTSIIPDQNLAFTNFDVEIAKVEDPPHSAEPTPAFIASIKATHGAIQPVILRHIDDDTYRIIAGRRRVKAHRILDYPSIFARVLEDDGLSNDAVLAILENEQRSDNPIVSLEKIEELIARGLNVKQIAELVNVKTTVITRYLVLGNLIPALRAGFIEGKIALGVAEKAAKLGHDYQRDLAEIFAQTGKVTGVQVAEAKKVRLERVQSSLPDELFTAGPSVTFDPVAKVREHFSEIVKIMPAIGPYLDELVGQLYQFAPTPGAPEDTGEQAAAVIDPEDVPL